MQRFNEEGIMLQKDMQTAKQLYMRICKYFITELMKPKTYYKRLLDRENNIKICVYQFRDIFVKCRIRYQLAVG